jgi:transcriptional regulator with XRE-family HTH domain
MLDSNEQTSIHPVAVIRPGLLDRLKTNSGIRSDDAFAKLIGVSRTTLQRYKAGEEPSLRAVISIADAFGLALGEVVVKTGPAPEPELAVAS